MCWTKIWTREEKIEVDSSGKLSVQVVSPVAVNTLQLKQEEEERKKGKPHNHFEIAFIEKIPSDSSEVLKRDVNFMIRCLII